ncbi:dipeptidase [Paraburkholderia megapolitana]|uniref:dipeptidase n=1 Tax=Paraburkholderia megapolitana TaxID=420953 RepID=UPI0038BB32ED
MTKETMPPDWQALGSGAADAFDGATIELSGWMLPLDVATEADYFLLTRDAPCCGGCVPADPRACVEVFATQLVPVRAQAVAIRGHLRVLTDDPAGWRYQLVDAAPAAVTTITLSRRAFLASGAALGLAACAPGRFANYTDATDHTAEPASAPTEDTSNAWRTASTLTIDMHSHAGHVTVSRDPAIGVNRPFLPVAAPMRAGGMNVICLAIVADTTATRISADRRRFEAWREPQPGELYALGQASFKRADELIEREQLQVVTDTASLAALGKTGPCVIVAAEGADFLEGRVERVDEVYTAHRLRHLQLTHYRVNELGDIQTAPPVHDGLTDFGADVVRRCNALGIVVDVAHGTYDLVKRAAATTTKPLVLSHTALSTHPSTYSRLISPDHARAIADTGGVIGVWPSSGSFHDLQGMAEGMKRMADVVGVEHVGLGTDLYGFISPPVFRRYQQLPALANALIGTGFSAGEVGMILGGNYRRVFEASVG